MSAGIVSGKIVKQDHQDDLESLLYTLLWVTVMYSKCPSPDQVSSLLATIFEPHRTGPKVNYAKLDFLRGRSFLIETKWPERRIVIELLIKLAELFATRYVNMTTDEGLSRLVDHTATINLFNAALKDRSQWPHGDAAVKQHYHIKQLTDELELKTGVNTSLFRAAIENTHFEAGEHPYVQKDDAEPLIPG
jgi:hypothetical protein